VTGHVEEADVATRTSDRYGDPCALGEFAVEQWLEGDERDLLDGDALTDERIVELCAVHGSSHAVPVVRGDGRTRTAAVEGVGVDFIFMLTRDDATIEDCLDVFATVEPLGLRHVGFKDVGVDPRTLAELRRRIAISGATTYLEVVSTTPEECLASAQIGRDLGIDRLMGGTQVQEVQAIISGTDIQYLPFPGLPVGHPTRLGGTPELVEAQCRAFEAQGCAGVDLLAYRATDAPPVELVRAARRGTSGYLVVAGSVGSVAQIDELRAAGADAFTIGSAVFDGSFSPRKGALVNQLRDVLAACAP
jgi:hypothetical protein